MPILLPEHCAHSQVKVEGFEPDSAGFFYMKHDFPVVDMNRISTSLNLGPKEGDNEVIIKLVALGLTDTMFYLE